MSLKNEPDWIEFKANLDQEIRKRAEIKKIIIFAAFGAIILCNILTAAVAISNGTKIQLLEKEIQIMNSVIISNKKNLSIYCRQ